MTKFPEPYEITAARRRFQELVGEVLSTPPLRGKEDLPVLKKKIGRKRSRAKPPKKRTVKRGFWLSLRRPGT